MVSEFMLQQTRVETVEPYYARWLGKFPDWDALAAATLDDVLVAWKGLGYYSRARNLHRTARAVRERHGGELPSDPAALRALPGVGEYTAGAVASIAFGAPAPAVDGNVRRVLARLLDLARPTPAQLRREAARLVDPARPGDHNEAMMELGATICTPRAPRCEQCPVGVWCAALARGTVAERPAPRRRRPVPRVDYATLVAVDRAGRMLLAKRPDSGLLAGMWEFPSAPVREPDPAAVAKSALERLGALGLGAVGLGAVGLGAVGAGALGAPDRRTALLPSVRHAFTHLRATYHPVIVASEPLGDRVPARPLARSNDQAGDPAPQHVWVGPAQVDEHALPVAQQKIARLAVAWMREAGPAINLGG